MAKPSSSVPPWPWLWDVFLSYRGEDTRDHFVQYLNSALCQAGILTFWDDHELRVGENMSTRVARAIEQSRISIIVISRKYATSRWCLDELLKILECKKKLGQLVIPIFVDVDPSELRLLTGSFFQSFTKYDEPERVNRWKAALQMTGEISGWDLRRYEPKFIQIIVKDVSLKLNEMCMITVPHLFGLEPRVKEFVSLLGIGLDEKRIVGIYGSGGIGKTTLAKAVHDYLSLQFEGSCFLANVKETSEKYGLVYLQEKLLSHILMIKNLKVGQVTAGAYLIKEKLHSKRVLIILDDLDDIKPLNALAAAGDWLGPGSRIIITTRSEGLLYDLKVNKRYEATQLSCGESLELFSMYAFGNKLPPEAYLEISKDFINYAGGIPLVLEVLGSNLHGRTWQDWTRIWENFKQIPSGESCTQLRVCIDSIGDDRVKHIFLIIACTFVGTGKDFVTTRLDGNDWFSESGINELIHRHLLTIDSNNELRMHDLLWDVGRRTASLCLVKNSIKFNTLISAKGIDGMGEKQELRLLDISKSKTRLKSIRSLEELQANDKPTEELVGSICCPVQPNSLCLNNYNLNQGLNFTSFEAKQKDKEDIGAQRSPVPTTLPTERSDHNKEIVEQNKPQSFKLKDENVEQTLKLEPIELEKLPEHLVMCTLYCCLFPNTYRFEKKTMVQLWVAEGFFELEEGVRTEVLAGAHFDYLIEKKFVLPSESGSTGWPMKYKVTDRISLLHFLVNAPQIDYLQVEEAQLCSVSEQIQHLFLILKDFNPTNLKNLSRFKHLHTLVLDCERCYSIGFLPHEFFLSLKNLRSLVLNRSGIYDIASSIGDLKYLCYLDISGNPIDRLPESIADLGKLQTLKLDGCQRLFRLPLELSKLVNLRHLEYDVIARLNSLPVNMGNLTSLQTLTAFLVRKEDGYRIEELKNLNNLSGSFCISRLDNVLSSHEAKEAAMTNKYLRKLDLRWGNPSIGGSKVDEEILNCLQPNACLEELNILGYSGSIFPSWINSSYLNNIVSVSLYKCKSCHVLPSFGGFPLLKTLYMSDLRGVSVLDHHFHGTCGSEYVDHAFPKLEKFTIECMSSLKEWSGVKKGDFPCLSRLNIRSCPKLVDLQWLSYLYSLKYLEISDCTEILSLGNEPLPSLLEVISISDCPNLKDQYVRRD